MISGFLKKKKNLHSAACLLQCGPMCWPHYKYCYIVSRASITNLDLLLLNCFFYHNSKLCGEEYFFLTFCFCLSHSKAKAGWLALFTWVFNELLDDMEMVHCWNPTPKTSLNIENPLLEYLIVSLFNVLRGLLAKILLKNFISFG